MATFKVYLYDFIRIIQGRPSDIQHMIRHILCAINEIFWPKTRTTLRTSNNYWSKNSAKKKLFRSHIKFFLDGLLTLTKTSLQYCCNAGKTHLTPGLCHPRHTKIIALPLSPLPFHPADHSTLHFRNSRRVCPDSARAEDNQWIPYLPICPCPHRVSYIPSMNSSFQTTGITLHISNQYL